MEKRDFRCPECGRLLFKGYFADIELPCNGTREKPHKGIVRIRVYSETALMLTADSTSDMIAIVQSREGIDPDCTTD